MLSLSMKPYLSALALVVSCACPPKNPEKPEELVLYRQPSPTTLSAIPELRAFLQTTLLTGTHEGL